MYVLFFMLLLTAVNQYPDLDKGDEQGEPPVLRHKQTHTTTTTSTVLNINDLPLPSSSRDLALMQSAVFIEDGAKYRSIHHKIAPRPLKIYQMHHSR